MSPLARLHDDQVDVSVEQVRLLIASQRPQWRDLAVAPVASRGTVNALFRVGADVVLRFPLCPRVGNRAELEAELAHAEFVAEHLPSPAGRPLTVARGLFVGEPGAGYPGSWSAWRWVPGTPAVPADVDAAFAGDLAGFVRTLHAVPTLGRVWSGAGRGGPLAGYDADVQECLAAASHLVDVAALSAVWSDAVGALRGDAPDTWLHADLMPGNLLVDNGRLSSVIDLGSGDVGDPAVDLMPMWNLFPTASLRAAYVTALQVDPNAPDQDMVRRGRGWALAQAVIALPNYEHTSAEMTATALRTLAAFVSRPGVFRHGEVTN